MNIIRSGLTFLFLCIFITGCASSRSGQVYSRDQARQVHTIQYGTVEAIEPVTIEGTKSGLGTAAGGVAGGVLGSTIGKGSGRTIATVLGAIAGGAAGTAMEEEGTKKDGIEITVRLDAGEAMAVVQEADEVFSIGDRVRVLTDRSGTVRVRR
ncbi:MAG: glycine zipper 2TM domain-containing protein [Deltaproteobacteria bacterium]|nr:glycine zipper 2TM domain-containing protein [Deltaproteobacteria bacterium]